MIGLKRGTVRLLAHEKEWESEAEKTISVLRKILADAASDIQHVGSTSVLSIKAKPIIDIAVATDDFGKITEFQSELEAAGIYYRPNADIDEQLLFASGSFYDGSGDMQTHFIHVVKTGSRQWNDYINFRNFLNDNLSVAKEYEALKLKLAEKAPVDAGRAHYLAGKCGFITRTLMTAYAYSFIGSRQNIVIDRPKGCMHKGIIYPLNYGYIPDTAGGDGEELDVYLPGTEKCVDKCNAEIIGMVRRKNDNEDKLIALPDGVSMTEYEIKKSVLFQEQFFESEFYFKSNLFDR